MLRGNSQDSQMTIRGSSFRSYLRRKAQARADRRWNEKVRIVEGVHMTPTEAERRTDR